MWSDFIMLILFGLAIILIPAIAQNANVELRNTTHPTSSEFQVGDGFEVLITGEANQPISVRTTMNARTNWSSVIGSTDASGRWSTTGSFDKNDFGDWGEIWTVGGQIAGSPLHFSVGAPCLKGAQDSFVMQMSLLAVATCQTAEGRETFATPSEERPFRTPDGRSVPGRTRLNRTAEQYQAEIMESVIMDRINTLNFRQRQLGDQAGALINKIIGSNALTDSETERMLLIVRKAYEKPDRIPQLAQQPLETLRLLKNLAASTRQKNVKQEIAGTIEFVQIL